MRIYLEDFKTGWYEISLGVKKTEIDNLIDRLHDLKKGDIDHFHITNNFEGEGGILWTILFLLLLLALLSQLNIGV